MSQSGKTAIKMPNYEIQYSGGQLVGRYRLLFRDGVGEGAFREKIIDRTFYRDKSAVSMRTYPQ